MFRMSGSCVLEEHGFLRDEALAGPLISGNVHQLFRRENWSAYISQTAEAWNAMSLTFSLTNKLLTPDSLLDWWLHMAFGHIELDTASQRFYIDRGSVANVTCWRIDFEILLRKLTEDIMFFWQPHKLASGEANWGTTFNCQDHFLVDNHQGLESQQSAATATHQNRAVHRISRPSCKFSCQSPSNTRREHSIALPLG